MLAGLFLVKEVDDAKEMHEKMIKAGLTPDIITHRIMLDGLCKNSCIEEAKNMFQSISRRCRPDIESFNILIDGMFRAGKTKEARDLFNAMFTEGLVPNNFTFTIMLKGLIKDGLLDEADELFLSMGKYSCSPNSVMLNTVVQGLLERGETMKAIEFLHKMREQHFAVEAYTAKLLIDLVSEKGGYEKYMKLLPDFSTDHVKSDMEISFDVNYLNLDLLKDREAMTMMCRDILATRLFIWHLNDISFQFGQIHLPRGNRAKPSKKGDISGAVFIALLSF